MNRTYYSKEAMWSLCRSVVASLLALGVFVIVAARATCAADWSLTPAVSLTGEYNDNVLFSQDEQDDFIAKLRPSLDAVGRTEQTEFRLHSQVTGEKYFDYEDLDTITTDNKASLKHLWSPRLTTNLSATFTKDDVLETEIERAGLTGVRKDRYRYGGEASVTYALTDTFSLTLGGGARRDEYPDGPYPDMTLWQGSLNPTWAITPRDTLGIFVNYYAADYEDTAKIKTLAESIYWRHDLTENTYITFGAGYRTTRTEYQVSSLRLYVDPGTGQLVIRTVTEDEESKDHGFIFNFSLNNTWTERFSTTINAGREQYNSIDARSIERSYIRATLRYRLTERASIGCNLGYDVTEAEGDEQGRLEEDTDYVRVSPYINYRVTENFQVQVAGSYEHKDNETDTYDISRERFRGWLTLSYHWPRLLATH